MVRSKSELLKSRERLASVAEALREEIRLLDKELAGYRKGTPLSEKFFQQRIVPILLENEDGISSSTLQAKLELAGYTINTVSLRTFLSRYRAKGRLIMLTQFSPPNWQVPRNLTPALNEPQSKTKG